MHPKIFGLPVFAIIVCCLLTTDCVSQQESQEHRSENQNAEVADPRSIGLDPNKLLEIESVCSQAVAEDKLVGCSALVFKDGQVSFFKTWGNRNRETNEPIERNTIFRIYSMSKPITSVAAMQLVERDKIDLDDPVSKYLPEFENLTVLQASHPSNGESDGAFVEIPVQRKMTVRDLLRHTSGLSYGIFGDTEIDKRYRLNGILWTDRNLEQMITKLGKIPLLYQPGTRFHYSVSTDVLGRGIEVAAEQRLDYYLEQNLFRPLGMNGTSFLVPADRRHRFAQLYQPNPKSGALELAPKANSFRFVNDKNRFFSAGMGLCSTVDDYLKFAAMLLNRGELSGTRIIQAVTVDQMFTNQLDGIERPSEQFKFGLGFEISNRGDYFWHGAAGTRFWVHPEKNMIVLFMTQILPYDPRPFGDRVRDIAYAAVVK